MLLDIEFQVSETPCLEGHLCLSYLKLLEGFLVATVVYQWTTI